ncbi:MAG: ATP synthase F0 subunit B, partial [Acidobacteriota bacterium]|nr:ATP synthase F0 subunit B [Acidobacteriota bacterium]
VLLDRLLLRPINDVIARRRQAIASARNLADESATRARTAADEFENRTQAARAEIYREMDERRRHALDRRSEVLGQTRREVEGDVAAARVTLKADADAARAQLERDAGTLAESIVERVLGRKAS